MPTTWALPCVPIAGKQDGVYMVPQIGAGVWIEFEQGDPDYPIWVGGFWVRRRRSTAAGLAPLPIPPGKPSSCKRRCRTRSSISDATPCQ